MDGVISDTELACRQTILNYISNNILTDPADTFRKTTRPEPMSVDPFKKTFTIPNAVIKLPDSTNKYYVYTIFGEDYILSAGVPKNKWFTTEHIAEKYHVLLHFYGTDGRMLSKSHTYIYIFDNKDITNTYRNVIFVAAYQDMCIHCIRHTVDNNGKIRQIDDIYLTAYYENYNLNDINILSYRFTDLSDKKAKAKYLSTINDALKKAGHLKYISIYENGYEITPKSKLNITEVNPDTYLDVIIDKNILFYFDIPLIIEDSSDFHITDQAYLSLRDKCWKQLIHIPRNLNSSNRVITHNVLDLWVRKKNSKTPCGVYVHRQASNNRYLYQLTHNDFAIRLNNLKSFQSWFPDEELYLHIVCRMRDKYKYLKEDSDFIRILYSIDHTDQNIIDILAARKHKSCYWWKAEQLEQGVYTEYYYDIPQLYSKDLIERFIEAFGYYKVISILGQCNYTRTPSGTSVSISVPHLYAYRKIMPVVYINKKYQNNKSLNYSTSNGHVTINNLSPQVQTGILTIPSDDRFVKTYVPFIPPSPSGDNVGSSIMEPAPSYPLPSCNYTIYRVGSTKPVQSSTSLISPVITDTGEAYLIPTSDYTIRDGRITFGSTSGTVKYMIIGTSHAYAERYKINGSVRNGTKISLVTEVDDAPPASYTTTSSSSSSDSGSSYSGGYNSGGSSGTGETITTTHTLPTPVCTEIGIPNSSKFLVYLNGCYLVEGVEYTLENETHDGYFLKTNVKLLTNHYNSGNNYLNVILFTGKILKKVHGYVQGNRIYTNPKIVSYNPETTIFHVNGRLRTDITDRGLYYELSENQNGKLFEIMILTATEVTGFLSPYLNSDNNLHESKLSKMNSFFS